MVFFVCMLYEYIFFVNGLCKYISYIVLLAEALLLFIHEFYWIVSKYDSSQENQ